MSVSNKALEIAKIAATLIGGSDYVGQLLSDKDIKAAIQKAVRIAVHTEIEINNMIVTGEYI